MDLVLWIENDTNLLVVESPINVRGVQEDGLVLLSEFRDMPPLTTPKSLEDEEKDESKR